MFLTLTNIHALVVVNRVILKLIAPTMRLKKEEQARKEKRKAKPRKRTLVVKIMKFLLLAHLQEMKRKICVLWQRMNPNQAV